MKCWQRGTIEYDLSNNEKFYKMFAQLFTWDIQKNMPLTCQFPNKPNRCLYKPVCDVFPWSNCKPNIAAQKQFEVKPEAQGTPSLAVIDGFIVFLYPFR